MGTANTPLLLNSSHDGGGEEEDGKPVTSVARAFGIESKKLGKIAGPTIASAICQYTLGALTQTFTGFVGELELAAVGIENSVVAGLAFGVMRRNRDDEIHRRLDIKSRQSSSMGQNYIGKAAFFRNSATQDGVKEEDIEEMFSFFFWAMKDADDPPTHRRHASTASDMSSISSQCSS